LILKANNSVKLPKYIEWKGFNPIFHSFKKIIGYISIHILAWVRGC